MSITDHDFRDAAGYPVKYSPENDWIERIQTTFDLTTYASYDLGVLFADRVTGQHHSGFWVKYWWNHGYSDPNPIVGTLLDQGIGSIADDLDTLSAEIDSVSATVSGVADAIVSAINAIGTNITNTITSVSSWLSDTLNTIRLSITDVITNVGDDIGRAIDAISTAVTGAVRDIGTLVYTVVVNIGQTIEDMVTAVGHDIATYVAAAIGTLTTAMTQIATDITTAINTIATDIHNAIIDIGTQISTSIDQVINEVIPPVLSVIQSTQSDITRLLSTLADSIKTPEDWVAGLSTALDSRYDELKARVADTFGVALPAALAEALAVLDAEASDTVDPLLLKFAAAPNVPPELATLLRSVGSPGSPISYIGKIVALGAILGEVVSPLLSPLMRPGAYIAENAARTKALTLGQAIEANKRGLLNDNEVMQVGGIEGYEDRLTQIQRDSAKLLLTPTEYVSLWRRGLMTNQQLESALAALGLDEHSRYLVQSAREYVPTTTDVLVWLTRDVFIPEFRQRFQMDAEFPTDSLPYFTSLGISEVNARNFWAGHWELPSIEQGYAMYRRLSSDASIASGEVIRLPDGSSKQRIIGQEDLHRLLRAHGVEPFWRDKQIAVAFHPFTRVDLRRMFAAGALTQSDVYSGYIALGYDVDAARALTQFAVHLAANATGDEEAPWKAGLKAKIISGFEDGYLSEPEARLHLSDLGFTDAQSSFFIHESVFASSATERKRQAAAVQKLYVSGLWTDIRATSELQSDGVPAAQIDRLLHDWSVEKQYSDQHAALIRHKELSRAEVATAYTEGVLTTDQARAHLSTVGWSDSDVAVILAEADYAAHKATATLVRSATRDLFVEGRISRAEASARLDAQQMPATQRDALLDTWDVEAARRIPKLPLSLLEKMVSDGIITHDDAHTELIGQHYTEREATLLLALWGDEIANAAAKAAVTAAKAAAVEAAKAAADAKAAKLAKAPTRVFLTTKQIFDAYSPTDFGQNDVRIFLLLNRITPFAVERLMANNLGKDYVAPTQSLADIDAEVLSAFGPNQLTLRDDPLSVERELRRYFGG